MKTLILMRHAKSSWTDSTLSDIERPLNGRGLDDAPLIGSWIAERLRPELVLCSPAKRTRETLDLTGLADGANVQIVDRIYGATAGHLVRLLDDVGDGYDNAMVIGHNPSMARLADALLYASPDDPNFERFPTAACAIIRFDIDSWAELNFGIGNLVDYTSPKRLKKFAP